jgi:MFS transporter, MHS family, proline/betaine transporter
MIFKKNYVIFVGILGTAFEWLEYSYYGYLTTKISQLFFPNYDARTGLLATMAIFAAGFIMRPIGGILFGLIGDKKGRKQALFLSILLMGCSTLMMGAMPTYQTIGIYAPLFLLVCRLLQGLAVAGEYNGAAIFLIEHNNGKYPNLAGSWVGTASAAGMLLGAFAATIVSYPGMPDWLWRVPFFLAFFSCLIANYLRYKMLESPLFLDAYRQQRLIKFPLKEVLKFYKTSFFQNLILAAFVSVYIYICTIYFVSHLIKDMHIAASQATLYVALGELVVVLFFPLSAFFSDQIGHKKIMLTGLLGTLIATPLLFIAAKSHSRFLLASSEVIFGITNALACAPIFNYIYQLFPTHIRYTGNSTAWSFGVAIFGGVSPVIAEILMRHFSFFGPWLYVSFFVILSIGIISKQELDKLIILFRGTALKGNVT